MESIGVDKFINNQIEKSIQIKQYVLDSEELLYLIKEVSIIAVKAYKKGNKILIAGNGGSAADAQHIAGELVNKFYFDRSGLPAIALSTDTSVLTAISNDYGFDRIFARQIQANGVAGDLFLGISTSGDSSNIILALEECKRKGIITVGLTGQSGGRMSDMCDYCIKIPSEETPRVQEAHIMVGHIICSIIEEDIFGRGF